MAIRKTNRIARRPLDIYAARIADEKLWKMNPQLHRRKLTMNRPDYLYRQEWMDTYMKHLKKHGASQEDIQKLSMGEMKQIDELCEREREELSEKQLELDLAQRRVLQTTKTVANYIEMEFMTERPSPNRRITLSPPPGFGGDWKSGGPGAALGKFSILVNLQKERDQAIKLRDKIKVEFEQVSRQYENALKRAAQELQLPDEALKPQSEAEVDNNDRVFNKPANPNPHKEWLGSSRPFSVAQEPTLSSNHNKPFKPQVAFCQGRIGIDTTGDGVADIFPEIVLQKGGNGIGFDLSGDGKPDPIDTWTGDWADVGSVDSNEDDLGYGGIDGDPSTPL